MIHKNRKWGVRIVSSESLASLLNEHSWTLCAAFDVGDSIWVNDSFSGDGATEFAVFRRIKNVLRQVESITVSWCNREKLEEYIHDVNAGRYDYSAREYSNDLSQDQLEYNHSECMHCR